MCASRQWPLPPSTRVAAGPPVFQLSDEACWAARPPAVRCNLLGRPSSSCQMRLVGPPVLQLSNETCWATPRGAVLKAAAAAAALSSWRSVTVGATAAALSLWLSLQPRPLQLRCPVWTAPQVVPQPSRGWSGDRRAVSRRGRAAAAGQ
eukprot:360981-Chlamydomonas_euryale.AAC.2